MCFGGNNQNQDAFLYGSLFLMLVPTIALGSLGYWVFRRVRAMESASEPPPRPDSEVLPSGEAAVLRVVDRS
jgi:hypothetical protein